MPIPQIHNDVFPFLMRYHWPGNVRELKNVVEQIMILHREEIISADLFPEYMKRSRLDFMVKDGETVPTAVVDEPVRGGTGARDYLDRALFQKIFNENHGDLQAMAVYFDCSYSTVKRYIGIHNIDTEQVSMINRIEETFGDQPFTIKDAVRALDVSMPTARKYLEEYCRAGKLKKEKKGRFIFFKVY
jgi:DNA-binding NtrC family response regulator